MEVVRSDNEPILQSEAWDATLTSLSISETHSIPYRLELNSQIERWIRSVTESLRAILTFVDRRLWCFALEHIATMWNLLPRRQKDGTWAAPADVITSLAAYSLRRPAAEKLKHARRFGRLCFFKVFLDEGLTTLDRRRRVGVRLGFSKNNSCYLVGAWVQDNRRKSGLRFAVYEASEVVFREDVLARDVDELKATRGSVTFDQDAPTRCGGDKPQGDGQPPADVGPVPPVLVPLDLNGGSSVGEGVAETGAGKERDPEKGQAHDPG